MPFRMLVRFLPKLVTSPQAAKLVGSVSPPQERCSIPGVDESIWETWVAWKFLAWGCDFFPLDADLDL